MDKEFNNNNNSQNINNEYNDTLKSTGYFDNNIYNQQVNTNINSINDLKNDIKYTEETNIFANDNTSLNDIVNNINDKDIEITNEINTNIIEVNFSNNVPQKNNNKKHRKFIDIIINRKTMMTISILTFIFIGITVHKTFTLRKKVNVYEKDYYVIEEKLSKETIIYNDNNIEVINNKLGAAPELVNCIKSPLNKDEIPNSINSIINEINNYYNQSNNYFSFKYKDIYTGFSVSYNENQNIFTASTIKAPKDIYIYEMASLGQINLNEKLTYTSNYANTGTGRLKNNKFNTQYDIKTLVEYSTVVSDNAAHNMLMDRFGRTNMLSFWQNLGTTAIFTANNNWGVTNAHDASIYMEELYRFYIEDEKYGQELMNNFLNASTKFIKGKNKYKIANKSGWSGTAIHDVSIIFADNPYIIVALSNLGNTDYYMSYFNKANDFAYRLHTEYWKYKMNICGNINQY